jgi:hypothetical protein
VNSSVPTAANHPDPILRLGLLCLAAIGFIVIVMGTPWGVGVTPDSFHYLQAATSFRNGSGLSEFPSHWPPLYPLAVAITSLGIPDVSFSARLLNATLLAINLVWVALLVRRLGAGTLFGLMAAILLAVQPGSLSVYLMSWSEPLFLTFVLIDVMLLHRLLRPGASAAMWFCLGLACAAAVMTRYAGLFLIVVNGLIIVTACAAPLRARLRTAGAVTLVSVLPFFAWSAYNAMRGVGSVNRAIVWHPPGLEHLGQLGETLAGWFGLPGGAGLVAFGVVTLLALARIVTRKDVDSSANLQKILASAWLAYFAFLLASISFVDYYTPLDGRILFPMFPVAWLVLGDFANRLRPASGSAASCCCLSRSRAVRGEDGSSGQTRARMGARWRADRFRRCLYLRGCEPCRSRFHSFPMVRICVRSTLAVPGRCCPATTIRPRWSRTPMRLRSWKR